jgi:hydroxymethylpyrimidine/phosphomethylpyrimidine kinase
MVQTRPRSSTPRVLAIAGSDPTGAAGLQADIKTITAMGAYAAGAVTALTVQTGARVTRVEPLAPDMVRGQIEAALLDIGADAIKIGMLGSADVATAVADVLEPIAASVPVVLDPVLASTSGTLLLDEAALGVLRERLFPLTHLLTPNLPEAALLTGQDGRSEADLEAAVAGLLSEGPAAILLKGGHGPHKELRDVLIEPGGRAAFTGERLPGRNTRGTGCALASAVAVGLAEGRPLRQAVARARAFVRAAIEAAPGLGLERGPMGHAFSCRFLKA